MKTSLDFDGCLGDVEQIQKLAAILLKGTSPDHLFILTARFVDHHNYVVYELAERLGIKKENVLICDGRPKTQLIKEHGIELHFDDDVHEVDAINERPELGCLGVLINFKLMEVLNNNRI